MPPVSEKQRRFFHAIKKEKSTRGRAAREAISKDPGGRLPVKVGLGAVNRNKERTNA